MNCVRGARERGVDLRFVSSNSLWEGFGRVADIYSPFNVINFAMEVVLLSPAIGAYFWLERRRKRGLAPSTAVSAASARFPDRATMEDVMDKYGALLQDRRTGVVRNISELPYPKATIKQVLLGLLPVVGDNAKMRNDVEVAYITLGSFQELTAEEDEAVRKYNEIMKSKPAVTEEKEMKELAKRITAVGDTYGRVLNRYSAEQTQLFNEIKKFELEHKLAAA